ncbi:hypothetical protein ABH892_000335 [Paenibacillus sp. RC254]
MTLIRLIKGGMQIKEIIKINNVSVSQMDLGGTTSCLNGLKRLLKQP